MTEENENWRSRDELDSTLDVALAKYAAAQPRVGLEERILANLRTVETRAGDGVWWNWGIATALAFVLIVAAALAWRRSMHPPIVKQTPVPTSPVSTEAKHHERNPGISPEKAMRRKARHPMEHGVVAAKPKLDVFPSPLPLSEQEKILAIYVAQYPQHAALVAEARMDALRQQEEERRRTVSGQDSGQ
jgi:hypothetical protein